MIVVSQVSKQSKKSRLLRCSFISIIDSIHKGSSMICMGGDERILKAVAVFC